MEKDRSVTYPEANAAFLVATTAFEVGPGARCRGRSSALCSRSTARHSGGYDDGAEMVKSGRPPSS
jgi:hypothetical protein